MIDLRQLLEIEMEGLAADVERVERRKATIAGLHTVLAAHPVLQDEDAWISTSDIAKQWRVSKSLVHKRLARSRLVEHPIPSRTVGGEKYVLRSYIAPILAAWCPHEDMHLSRRGQGQAADNRSDSLQAISSR